MGEKNIRSFSAFVMRRCRVSLSSSGSLRSRESLRMLTSNFYHARRHLILDLPPAAGEPEAAEGDARIVGNRVQEIATDIEPRLGTSIYFDGSDLDAACSSSGRANNLSVHSQTGHSRSNTTYCSSLASASCLDRHRSGSPQEQLIPRALQIIPRAGS